jgi:hypothetical protein
MEDSDLVRVGSLHQATISAFLGFFLTNLSSFPSTYATAPTFIMGQKHQCRKISAIASPTMF